MQPSNRRAIGLVATLLFICIYVVFAAGIGNLLAQKSVLVKIIYFAIAGIIWVFPLYPLYKWMRPRPHEITFKEAPPKVSKLR